MNRSLANLSPSQRAWTCALINQCATPGLGSLLARRFVSGSLQLALAIAGFILILAWMVRLFHHLILQQLGRSGAPAPSWLLKWGALCFGAAWVWSLGTSIQILLRARAAARRDDAAVIKPRPDM
ncbi:MAG TPA: hypothetical protein PKH32_01290 [Verrucomicrobiota bacterium]|nr:hypothetical protein [Verrucomicrobiota bacterium]